MGTNLTLTIPTIIIHNTKNNFRGFAFMEYQPWWKGKRHPDSNWAPTGASQGDTYYNTNTKKWYFFDRGRWAIHVPL